MTEVLKYQIIRQNWMIGIPCKTYIVYVKTQSI